MYVYVHFELWFYIYVYVSSPYMLVFGDDRVMFYTGEDDVAGGAGEE